MGVAGWRTYARGVLDHTDTDDAATVERRVVGRGVSRALLPSPVRVRRTGRDWTVDVVCFLVAVIGGWLFLWGTFAQSVQPPGEPYVVTDAVLGVVAGVSLWWRRRWPVAVAVGTTVLSVAFAAPAIASVIALFTVAVHRRLPIVAPIAVAQLISSFVFAALVPQRENPFWVQATTGVLLQSAVIAWGMFVRARRQLLISLRVRAERAEAEQRLRADQARRSERTRIAREMHDVLAHRVSLIALHAGALEVRADLPPDSVRETAGLIRGTARQALEELRSVIGVLRDENGTEDVPNAPQPTLSDLPRLVSESGARRRPRCAGHAGGSRRAGAHDARPGCVPDRPGGPHQRDQARARNVHASRVARWAGKRPADPGGESTTARRLR